MTKIRLRRGTAAAFTSLNPILQSGEPGFETNTGLLKIGDGSTAWNSLAYQGSTFTGDASDIPILDAAADFTATDVEGALAELQSDAEADAAALAAHLADTSDAHDASAVSSVAAGTLAATDVQAALNELDTEKAATASAVMDGDTAGGVLDGTYPSPGLAAGVAGAGLAETSDVLSVNVDGSTLEINSDTLRVKDGGVTVAKLSFDPATQAELDAHTGDTSAAHAASAISADSTTLVGVGTDVQAVLEELDDSVAAAALATRNLTAGDGLSGGGNLTADRTFTVNVDGSTIETSGDAIQVKDGGITVAKLSFDPATQAELDAHTGDTSAAHAASAVSADSTTLVGVGTDVQAVLEELDDGVAAAALATRTLTAGDGLSGGGNLTADRTFTVNVDGSTIETNADALRVKDGGITVAKLSFDPATQAELDAHTGDTSAAHAASAVSADSTTLVGVGTDVQAVLEELDDGIANHLADSSAAHAASAISADSTTLVGVGTDVQAVLEELDDGVAAAALASRTLTAGDGLSGGGTLAADRTFTVNVDGTTIETSGDALRIKDGGVTAAKVAADVATQAELDTAVGTLVAKSLYDANTILKADSDDTPAALTMGASTILARLAAGNIVAATPAELRTLLALVIGTNVQAWDADLDAVAALTPTNDDVLQRKAGVWTNRTQAQLIADLAALGTTFQPLDSDLTAIAALATTAYGRAFLALADAAAARAALALGTAALNATGDFALTGDARLSDTRPSQYQTTVDLTIPDNSMLVIDGYYELGATQVTEITGTAGVLFVRSDVYARVFDIGMDASGGFLEIQSS